MMFLGGAVLRATLTDVYLRYVKQGLQPFLIVAGVLLVGAAVMTLVYEFRDRRRVDERPEDGGHGHDDGHGHHAGPVVGWLLLLPALALLFVTPAALGAETATRTGSALTSSQDTAYPPLPPGDPVKLTLFGYGYRAVYDEGRTLRDRQIELTGFIAPGPDGQPMLARIILTCCAADGIPIKIGLSGDVPNLPADTWVQATGRWFPHTAKDPVNGSDIPYFHVDTWKKVKPPTEPYE